MAVETSHRMGVVGLRAYEPQAWRSPSYGALEQAVWTQPAATPVESAHLGKSWFKRVFEALAFLRRSPAR